MIFIYCFAHLVFKLWHHSKSRYNIFSQLRITQISFFTNDKFSSQISKTIQTSADFFRLRQTGGLVSRQSDSDEFLTRQLHQWQRQNWNTNSLNASQMSNWAIKCQSDNTNLSPTCPWDRRASLMNYKILNHKRQWMTWEQNNLNFRCRNIWFIVTELIVN